MNSKKLILATLAATIIMMLLGFTWYTVLMADFYQSNMGSASGVMKDPMSFPQLILGVAIIGFVMAYMFPKWSRGINNAKQGFIFGALIGLIIGFGMGFINIATANIMNMSHLMADGVFHLFEQGFAGIAIALIYGKSEES